MSAPAPSQLVLAATVILLLASAGAGYLLGENAGASRQEAARVERDAESSAYPASKERSAVRAVRRGLRDGELEGAQAGRLDGTAEGAAAGQGSAEAQLAEVEVPAPESPELVCDGAITDDALFAACAAQSGTPIPQSGDYGINPAEVCLSDPTLAQEAGFSC